MTKILEEDDDGTLMPDVNSGQESLHALLKRATAATVNDRRLKEARKRLTTISGSGHPAAAGESIGLLDEIRKLEEGRVWITHARIALFHTQQCATCGSRHEFFMGWKLEQKHVSDKTARKLTPDSSSRTQLLPERREDHSQGMSDTCGNCVESVIAIDVATGLAAEEK